MEEEILVLDADDTQCNELCTILKDLDCRATPTSTLQDFKTYMDSGEYRVVILDLDSLSFDKNFFIKLKKIKPTIQIMGLSSRPFHPELEDVMSRHIYACLSKPVDEEELAFWIKSLTH